MARSTFRMLEESSELGFGFEFAPLPATFCLVLSVVADF